MKFFTFFQYIFLLSLAVVNVGSLFAMVEFPTSGSITSEGKTLNWEWQKGRDRQWGSPMGYRITLNGNSVSGIELEKIKALVDLAPRAKIDKTIISLAISNLKVIVGNIDLYVVERPVAQNLKGDAIIAKDTINEAESLFDHLNEIKKAYNITTANLNEQLEAALQSYSRWQTAKYTAAGLAALGLVGAGAYYKSDAINEMAKKLYGGDMPSYSGIQESIKGIYQQASSVSDVYGKLQKWYQESAPSWSSYFGSSNK